MLNEEKPRRIIDGLSEEAFETFPQTTHWSNTSNYFILNNSEVYNTKGTLLASLKGVSSKWSPNDEYIAYIKKPADLQKSKIILGEWPTFIGTEMNLFTMKDKSIQTLFEYKDGLIDVIDSIQWSKDSSMVGISVGKINVAPEGVLESVDYEKVLIYNIPKRKKTEVKNFPYNYYEFLFNTHIYGTALGKREVLEIIEIEGENRKIYEHPFLLNSRDMFVISHKDEAYLIDGMNIIKLNPEGQEEKIMELPWNISEMYFEAQTRNLIIINDKMSLFLLKR